MKKHSRVQQNWRKKPSKELANAIIRTRQQNGWGQAAFSRFLNKNLVTVGRWERGVTVPYPSVLAQLIMVAPADCRPVFEDYMGKTYDQVLRERFGGFAGNEHTYQEEWSTNPREHATDIAGVIHNLVEQILSVARGRDEEGSKSLLSILKGVLKEVEKLHKQRGKHAMIS